jgi:WhiB family redox-sensing transcriptional regulator
MTQDWHLDAVCATTDPDLFWPDKGDRHGADKAKRICASCPVVQQCLEFAIVNEEREGVWGNTTPEQRSRIRRRAR